MPLPKMRNPPDSVGNPDETPGYPLRTHSHGTVPRKRRKQGPQTLPMLVEAAVMVVGELGFRRSVDFEESMRHAE